MAKANRRSAVRRFSSAPCFVTASSADSMPWQPHRIPAGPELKRGAPHSRDVAPRYDRPNRIVRVPPTEADGNVPTSFPGMALAAVDLPNDMGAVRPSHVHGGAPP